jgi:hypothetical protein
MRNSNFARIVLLNQVPESPLLVSAPVVLHLEVLLISVALHLSEDLLCLEGSELVSHLACYYKVIFNIKFILLFILILQFLEGIFIAFAIS